MSARAIAAALALADLSCGERLVAFSLASFANREHRAWPGTTIAAARAGLGKSRYLEARDLLIRRGLARVEDSGAGHGRATTLTVAFAASGLAWDGEINAELLEAVLSYSRARGPARLLLAALAAVSSDERIVEGVTTEEASRAAGLGDRSYRRARQSLLASGELVVLTDAGGRGVTNRWQITDPRLLAGELGARPMPGKRVPPPLGATPLIAAVHVPGRRVQPPIEQPEAAVAGSTQVTSPSCGNPGHDRTLHDDDGPILTGVSEQKGGQDRTFGRGGGPETPAQTPAQTPAETPAPYVRAGGKSQNQGTRNHPPNPPQGGPSHSRIVIEEGYVTERGRNRRRLVHVDLDAVRRGLLHPSPADRGDWATVRSLLLAEAGESTFGIWLDPLELIGVDAVGTMVLTAPPELLGWVRGRWGSLISRCGERAGRKLRFAEDKERAAMDRGTPADAGANVSEQPATNRSVS
jgi:hypothetical protein